MPTAKLNKGLQVVLYFLLSTDSALRRALEGTDQTPTMPPASATELLNRFDAHIIGTGSAANPQLGFTKTAYPKSLTKLFVSGSGSHNVATDTKTILAAVDAPYDPDAGPCPDVDDEVIIISDLDGQV